MKRIDLNATLQSLKAFAVKYNAGISSGRKLRMQHISFAMDLIRLQAHNKGGQEVALQGDLIPPVRTNNLKLSALLQIHFNTVVNYRNRLKEAGGISEVWHGRHHGYDVCVNILCIRLTGSENERLDLDNRTGETA